MKSVFPSNGKWLYLYLLSSYCHQTELVFECFRFCCSIHILLCHCMVVSVMKQHQDFYSRMYYIKKNNNYIFCYLKWMTTVQYVIKCFVSQPYLEFLRVIMAFLLEARSMASVRRRGNFLEAPACVSSLYFMRDHI